MNRSFIKSGIVAGTLFFMSCRPGTMQDARSYFGYLSDPAHGLVKEKTIAGIRYKVKYLPAEYLAWQTLQHRSVTAVDKDSVVRAFDGSLTFLLNIGPAEGETFDISRLGVNDYTQFAERIERMAFEAQEWMSITSGSRVYKPTLAKLENLNSPGNSQNFIVVFSSEKNTGADLRNEDLCFTYSDELFNTGTNNFIFKAADLDALPAFKF